MSENAKIRSNAPDSIQTEEEVSMYQSLVDDISNNGQKLRYDDRHALGELAATLVSMVEMREDIRENGRLMSVSGDKGLMITKPNPAVADLQKAQVHVKAMFREFNMTPSSRGSKGDGGIVGGKDKAEDDNWSKV